MVARITLSMLAVIIVAEIIAGIVWFTTTSTSKRDSAWQAMAAISAAAFETIDYFADLPVNYRYLVLEQLRNVGGTRFFISINNRSLSIPSLTQHTFVPDLEHRAQMLLQDKLSIPSSLIDVTLTRRDEMLLFNSGITLKELPALWKDYSIVLGELDLPIVVVQVQLSNDEWLYLATVMPLSFSSLTETFLDGRQLVFLLIATIMLVGVSYFVVQKEVRPFRSLARSATLMGAQMRIEEITEEGSTETQAAIHAFNKMNRRIKAYLRDRETFFNAISHDIKTPLACLKLRTEMLDDAPTRSRFEKLLTEIEMMLDGALQCMKDSEIHEELAWIDINDLLEQCAAVYNRESKRVTVSIAPKTKVYGKPLAIKRCLFNLVDNGIKYGDFVSVEVSSEAGRTEFVIHDSGPGIDEVLFEKVFSPYFRATNKKIDGSGLGLSISRSIARAHGGDILLENSLDGGFVVRLALVDLL
ncbi:HAMP domain-containing sensor histidine kinase [Vibrio cionasavignyae]|uniref:HAMP domain-containing sensor histidine kinase n=1 Tax=Vibrio cionasavignyae TaxID=2910252 RepID=UPI003D0E6B9B